MTRMIALGALAAITALLLNIGPLELSVPVYMFAGIAAGPAIAEARRWPITLLRSAFYGAVAGLAIGVVLPIAIARIAAPLDAYSAFLLNASVLIPQSALLMAALFDLGQKFRQFLAPGD